MGDFQETEAPLGETPNAELGVAETPNDLIDTPNDLMDAELGEIDTPNDPLGVIPAELGDLSALLTAEMETVDDEQELKINPQWRVERRNDRTPPGFAIFWRGTPVRYIGYVGYYSKGQKPEGFPTYSQLRGDG